MNTQKAFIKKFVIFTLVLIFCIQFISAQDYNKVLVVKLNYNSASPAHLSVLNTAAVDGVVPFYRSTIDSDYVLEMFDEEGNLYTIRFKVPFDALLLTGLTNDISGDKDNLNFSLYLPYFENATSIKIYDVRTGNLTLEIPLSVQSQIPNPENNSGYNLPNYSWMYIVGPIALILGLLVYVEVRRRKDHARLMINQRNNNAEALKNYVEKYIKKGYSKEQIRNALIKNNYNSYEIEEAFKGIK